MIPSDPLLQNIVAPRAATVRERDQQSSQAAAHPSVPRLRYRDSRWADPLPDGRGSSVRASPRWVLAPLVVLAGCGLKRISPDIVQRLPVEAKIQLLEAENDLYIAIDRHDEAVDRALHTRDELRRARDRIGEAKDARKRAREGGDAREIEVADLSVEEAYQKRDWLDDWVEVQWDYAAAEEASLEAARARFERAKASLAKKANVEGSEKLSSEAFENQVRKLEARAKEKLAEADAERKKAEESRTKWNTTRRALAQKTGGALGSPWVE